MRVFVAGASGVIGRSLVPQLVAAGHEVTGMTRSPDKLAALEQAGASAVLCDALDAAAVDAAVAAAAPDVIVNQLTDLPPTSNPRKLTASYEATNRVRTEGSNALLAAAHAHGARRMVAQSIAFLYAAEGDLVKDEDARPYTDAPAPFGGAVKALLEMERGVTQAPGIDGIVLRYGIFYGPGTWYADDGSTAADVRRRRFPIVGGGAGTFSFIHVDDAAAATVLAVERGAPGIYNVVDDDPAPLREWLPFYAEALGAKRPLRVPTFVARIAAGGFATMFATALRGASNARAKRELAWSPRYASWRQGFREALG
ncbi:MAG TPA: NAD(P)-dependent oxidoreductase [Solirubrobacteraceae bacterium]|nr:NAD(P)-dependent oxidoreductase [Solirubrobacteraceae bacterium]